MDPITLAIQALTGLINATSLLAKSLQIKRENGEMTPEQESAYDAAAAAEMKQPWWKKSTE